MKSFAEDNGIGRLSMWSVTRDMSCPGGGATFNRNGISAPQWAYTEVFRGDYVPPVPQCDDGQDNDGDGLVDAADPTTNPPTGGITVEGFTVTSDWGTGYCADAAVVNSTGNAIPSWTATFTVEGTVSAPWNAQWSQSGSQVQLSPSDWNATLAVGASAHFGFCATR